MWCHKDNPMRPFPIITQDLPMIGLQPVGNRFEMRELWWVYVNLYIPIKSLYNFYIPFEVL